MQLLARFLALLLAATAALRAGDSLAHARQAQALLGPGFWSRVLRIENETRRGAYPRTLHALVFEFAGILWFYTDTNGTQSFSLHRGQLAADKADFGPLLHDIEPGFTRWRVLPDANEGDAPRLDGALPNGCFIASIVAGFELLARGLAPEVRLLSFYHDTPEGRRGHTVLTYAVPKGVAVLDPTDEGGAQIFSAAYSDDARALAGLLERMPVSKARWLPLELPGVSRGTARATGGAAAVGNAAAPLPVVAALR